MQERQTRVSLHSVAEDHIFPSLRLAADRWPCKVNPALDVIWSSLLSDVAQSPSLGRLASVPTNTMQLGFGKSRC